MTTLQTLIQLLGYNPAEPMMFNSGSFLLLFLVFTLIYGLLYRRDTLRIVFVTLFSYYFYYKSSGFCFLLLALVTVSDYLIGAAIDRRRAKLAVGEEHRHVGGWLMALSLIIDLGLLGYFKYANFFGASLMEIMSRNFQPWDIVLPVGISFFTFQSMSYTIDIYRGRIQPVGSLLDYAFYVSFFPQLVAGPIVRASDFIPQIRKQLSITPEMLAQGLCLVMMGLVKKCIISDYISLNFVDRVFDNPSLYTGLENLLAVYGYAMQIYCDFSGYSDMAIGIALMLGFHFPPNFRSPYKSVNISEFWFRWHISLSSWVKDYIYISLGGSHHGKVRRYVNLLITMTLMGLWHGADITFVLWGVAHGVALCIHKFWRETIRHRDREYRPSGLSKVIGGLVTFHFVCLCWILFRSDSLQTFSIILSRIAYSFHLEVFVQVIAGYSNVLLVILLGYAMHFTPARWLTSSVNVLSRCNVVVQALLMALVIFLVIQMRSTSIQPFIYFQF